GTGGGPRGGAQAGGGKPASLYPPRQDRRPYSRRGADRGDLRRRQRGATAGADLLRRADRLDVSDRGRRSRRSGIDRRAGKDRRQGRPAAEGHFPGAIRGGAFARYGARARAARRGGARDFRRAGGAAAGTGGSDPRAARMIRKIRLDRLLVERGLAE